MSKMSTVRIKICGITRAEDGVAAAAAGADAIGLVFTDKSPRSVDIDQAIAICRSLPPFVTRVGLFMDAPAAAVESTLAGCRWTGCSSTGAKARPIAGSSSGPG